MHYESINKKNNSSILFDVGEFPPTSFLFLKRIELCNLLRTTFLYLQGVSHISSVIPIRFS